jgi:predicted Zn-dependent peptidase
VLGSPVPAASAAKAISAAQEVLAVLGKTGPTAAEFERARGEALAELSRQSSQQNVIGATADNWLNSEIYKLQPAVAQISSFTLGDIQRVSAKLFKNVAIATIAVGNVEQLKSSLGTAVEVRGAKPEKKTANDSAVPVKKP